MAYTSQNQSVAAFVAADKVAFYHCGFYSTHNTLFDYKGRHYYDGCYIQGSIDFIFGRGRSVFHVNSFPPSFCTAAWSLNKLQCCFMHRIFRALLIFIYALTICFLLFIFWFLRLMVTFCVLSIFHSCFR